jgi:uncharacterized protein (TIGR01244 family)
MHANTLKTILGYLKSKLPWTNDSSEIYNHLQLTDTLATSGQPTIAQFVRIQQAGYQTVINLAPTHTENAIDNESSLVNSLGMDYVHIPVDFKQPTEQDFSQFCDAMRRSDSQKTWVHCAANMRVSAFVYRYRRDVLGQDKSEARRDLHKIWQPYGVWKQFLAE